MNSSPNSQSTDLADKLFLLLALAGGLCFLLAAGFAADRSPFLDEAAYIQNLHLPAAAFFDMLPYYDAARPPAVSLLLGAVWQGTGSILALRLAVLFMYVASLLVFVFTVAKHRSVMAAALLTLFLCALPEAVRYVTEVKHFGLEMATAMLLLSFLLPRTQRPLRIAEWFGIAALVFVLSLFSLSIILVMLAVAGERVLFSGKFSTSRSWGVAALVALAAWLPCYLFIHQPILVAQLSNYPDVYETFSLANSWNDGRFWQHSFRQLVLMFGGTALLAFWALVLVSACIANWRSLLDSRFQEARMMVALIAGILLASLLDQYPITSSRQLLFVMPLIALAFATCGAALAKRLHWALAVIIALPVLALAAQNSNDARNGDFDHQPLAELMQVVAEHPSDTVLMFNAIQPGWVTMEAVTGKRFAKTVLAWVPPGTGVRPNWADVEQNFDATMQSPIAWSALSHLRDQQRFDLYTDWLVSQVTTHGTVLLPVAQMFPDRTRALKKSLAARSCQFERIYINKGVQLYEIACP